jgi:hypothetical protein
MSEETNDSVAQALDEASTNGRIPCNEALALAERLGVDTRELGEAANQRGIKIVACQLGCF